MTISFNMGSVKTVRLWYIITWVALFAISSIAPAGYRDVVSFETASTSVIIQLASLITMYFMYIVRAKQENRQIEEVVNKGKTIEATIGRITPKDKEVLISFTNFAGQQIDDYPILGWTGEYKTGDIMRMWADPEGKLPYIVPRRKDGDFVRRYITGMLKYFIISQFIPLALYYMWHYFLSISSGINGFTSRTFVAADIMLVLYALISILTRYVNANAIQRYRRLALCGIQTDGTVVDCKVVESEGSFDHYKFVVEFTTSNGISSLRKFTQMGRQPIPDVGTAIPIVYLPSNPYIWDLKRDMFSLYV